MRSPIPSLLILLTGSQGRPSTANSTKAYRVFFVITLPTTDATTTRRANESTAAIFCSQPFNPCCLPPGSTPEVSSPKRYNSAFVPISSAASPFNNRRGFRRKVTFASIVERVIDGIMGACLSATTGGGMLIDNPDGDEEAFHKRFLEDHVLGEGEFGQVKMVREWFRVVNVFTLHFPGPNLVVFAFRCTICDRKITNLLRVRRFEKELCSKTTSCIRR